MRLHLSLTILACIFLFFQVGAGYTASADSYDTFDVIVRSVGYSIVTTNDTTNVEETTATLNGFLVDDAGFICQYRFEYDTDAGVPYAFSTPWAGAINTGQAFGYGVSSLTKGELYFVRAQCNTSGGNVSSGSEKAFLTKPDRPTNFLATSDGNASLSWTKGNGADRTVIVRKQDSYPLDRADGTTIYNDTSNSYFDTGVTIGNHYYYRAWSYCSEGGLCQFSDDYDGDHILVVPTPEFDLHNIIVLDNIVPDLVISAVVENKGHADTDITVSWVLSRVDNSVVMDMGSDTFQVLGSSEKIYIIYPTTSYVGGVTIVFVGDGATASKTFSTESPPAAPPAPGLPLPPPPVVPPPVAPPLPAPPAVPSWMIIIFMVAVCLLVFFVILIKREEEEKSTSKHKSVRWTFIGWFRN